MSVISVSPHLRFDVKQLMEQSCSGFGNNVSASNLSTSLGTLEKIARIKENTSSSEILIVEENWA